MAEFAFSNVETVNSLLPGYTKNPFALDRVTAGSSGGTAAAVSANLGEVGLGTDTGNSIRGPSAHNALVGIRSTMGLTSRAGIAPLSLFADIAGPIARTVSDAVAVFQVVAGYDPDDAATDSIRGRAVPNYAASLDPNGLRGARIGVLRQAYERPTLDSEVVRVFAKAVQDLRRAGATVIDTVIVAELDSIRRSNGKAVQPVQVRIQQLARRARRSAFPSSFSIRSFADGSTILPWRFGSKPPWTSINRRSARRAALRGKACAPRSAQRRRT